MDSHSHLRRLLEYDRWANHEVLDALEALDSPPLRSVQLLAHIIAAQQLWIERILGRSLPVKVWPDWMVQECAAQLENSLAAWRDLIDGADGDRLRSRVSYTNSKGERWQNNVEDIATHVAMHGTYHRAQIAQDLRKAGIAPPYTDYIEAVRRGHLSEK